jgi:hypothetical protein
MDYGFTNAQFEKNIQETVDKSQLRPDDPF